MPSIIIIFLLVFLPRWGERAGAIDTMYLGIQMLMPDPDKERHSLPIENFLDRISDIKKKAIYKSLLYPLPTLLDRIKLTWPTKDGIPDIRITTNATASETELRDLANTVCLAEGLLELCLDAQNMAEKTLGNKNVPRPFGRLSVAKACLMWSCAHEVFHYIRRHALVEKHFGSSPDTKQALELDADKCAVAAFYRYMQYFKKNTSNTFLKKTALRVLYFVLRIGIEKEGLAPHGTGTHPHTAARIVDILSKLATLNDDGVADRNCELETTKRDADILGQVLMDLEAAYFSKNHFEKHISESDFVTFTLDNGELQYTGARHKRWEEIQPLIYEFSTLPREVVDNETSIAFIGDHYSMPR